jgi:hypothetical protein
VGVVGGGCVEAKLHLNPLVQHSFSCTAFNETHDHPTLLQCRSYMQSLIEIGEDV